MFSEIVIDRKKKYLARNLTRLLTRTYFDGDFARARESLGRARTIWARRPFGY